MDLHIGYIMTVSNSIIGVSILAMPYCFKQCGILLAILMLLASGVVSRLTCHYLLKSAMISRRRTFELLSFHTFGSMGKLMVELGIIGFLMGTCVAYFVIIGDLGPAIIAKILEIENNGSLRMTLLICLAVFCVVPLGLLKNVDSLNSVSIATIGFYFCLVLKIMAESATHLVSDDLFSKVELWKPQGILQCFPIFAMALSCQTQLFEIYETLPNATLEKMNYVVRSAVNICVCVYILVGFFGYVAFVNYPFTGNILMNFSPSLTTDAMKIGFVLSVACSFPLVIFPCRASLYSLLFKKGYMHAYEGQSNFIPENRFKLLTLFIVGVSLIIGILIPNIEVVLGLLGSTIGIMICVIFPVTCFICISMKNTNERILAQILLCIGIIMMVMGTYANLYAMEEINTAPAHLDRIHMPPIDNVIESKPVISKMKDKYVIDIKKGKILKGTDPLKTIVDLITMKPIETANVVVPPEPDVEIRKEPPQPVEPEEPIVKEKEPPPIKIIEENIITPAIDPAGNSNLENKKDSNVKVETNKQTTKASEQVNKAAIEKEENEIKEEGINKKNQEVSEKSKNADELLKTLEKHKEEQKNLIQQQKELLEEIKKETKELKDKHLSDIQNDSELRAKAANQIVEIAKKAIESLGPKDDTIKNAEKIIESLGSNVEKGNSSITPGQQKGPVKQEVLPDNRLEHEKAENILAPKDNIVKNYMEVSKINKENMVPLPLLINIRENGKNQQENKKFEDNLKISDVKMTIPSNQKLLNTNQDQKIENEVIKNDNNNPEVPNKQILPQKSIQNLPKQSEVKEIPLIDTLPVDKIVPKIEEPILEHELPSKDVKSPEVKTEKTGEKIGRDILQQKTEKPETPIEVKSAKISETPSSSIINNNNISKIGRDLLETNFESDIQDLVRNKREISQNKVINGSQNEHNKIQDGGINKINKNDENCDKLNNVEKNKQNVLSDNLIGNKIEDNLPNKNDILDEKKSMLDSLKFTQDMLLKTHENLRRK